MFSGESWLGEIRVNASITPMLAKKFQRFCVPFLQMA